MVNISAVVGTAYVRLRLLTDTIGKDIKSAVEKSDLQDIDIKVNADTLGADADLEATGVKADELGRKSPKITPKVDTKDSKKDIGALSTAIGLLGPSLGPLSGAAAAAFGGLAAGAAVALLAVQGVKKEMANGTATGDQFRAGVQLLQKDLGALESTAAKAVLPGFQQTVSELNTALPGVNKSVGVLGKELGDIGSHIVVGLVSGLQTFEPLLLHVGQAADIAARHFQDWATSTGGGNFANTLGESFDRVLPVLANLTQAVGNLIAAFAPVGTQVVGIIGGLAAAINAIPLPVLQGLADVFVALFAAKKLVTVFNNISISLRTMAVEGELAGTKLGGLAGSAAGITKFAGAALAGGFAIYSLGQSISAALEKNNSFVSSLKNASVAQSSFFNALAQSKGVIDDTVRSSVAYQTAQDGLTKKAGLAGISQDQLTKAIIGTDDQTNALIDTWNKSGKPSGDTIVALEVLHKQYQEAADNAAKYNAEQLKLANSPAWGALKTTADSATQVAAKYHLSSDAVTQYASLLGISSDAIKNGVVTNKQLADAVTSVSAAYNTASASGSSFLDSLQKFSTSAGTAADRAQLIGAYLKAAQGDLLSYSSAVASAYQANYALTDSFKQQADQVKAGTLALDATEKAAINLKTGMIDVAKQGAGPLIQQLQAMQDAAMGAAEATYQHELALGHTATAASSAAKIFQNETYTALVNDAKQLGLTTAQAEKLAKSYFSLPKDVETQVKAIGTDPVVTVLNEIGKQLAFLTGHPWTPTVGANTAGAKKNINSVNDALHGLHGKTIAVGANTDAADRALRDLAASFAQIENPIITPRIAGSGNGRPAIAATGGLITYQGVQRRAGGGPAGLVQGPGSGTSDTAGLFALSNGEYVINAMSTKRYLPLLRAINSGGMASGGTPGAGGGMGTASILAAIQALAGALANRPVQLEANGLVMAKVVNDANLKNARRNGQ